MDPSIISAIISAVVSVLIAGVSGLYVLSKTGREIEQLKMKIVTEDHSKRFVTEASEYRKKYNAYISSGILNDTNENRLEIIWKCCSLCIELFEALYEQSVVV